MAWLTVDYKPGFAWVLTSWTTTIERGGKLRQQVNCAETSATIRHRALLNEGEIAEIARLVAAIDFERLQDAHIAIGVGDDLPTVFVSLKEDGQVRSFGGPLFWWEQVQKADKGAHVDLRPALALWWAVNRFSPHQLLLTSDAPAE